MDVENRERIINMGENIGIARKWKKISQEVVAEKSGLHQTEISALEKQKTIDKVILDKIAEAMNIPVDFLADFSLAEVIETYDKGRNVVADNDFTMTQHDISSGDQVAQKNNIDVDIENQTNNYVSPELLDFYKQILNDEKEARTREVETKDVEIKFWRERALDLEAKCRK